MTSKSVALLEHGSCDKERTKCALETEYKVAASAVTCRI